MSEFGNETATATFRSAQEAISAFMKLLKFLLERGQNRTANKLKKMQLKDMKYQNRQQKAQRKLTNRKGYVRAELLRRSGEKLKILSIPLSDEELVSFDRYANLYGVVYSSISNQDDKGIKDHVIMIKEKDAQFIKDITDRMNEDIKLNDLNQQIDELENTENRTAEQEVMLQNLKNQRDGIGRDSMQAFNNENADIIFSDVCGELETKAMSFERALNRFTDRDFSRDEPYYACERTNPNSYIELKSSYDTYNGDQYTKTDYRVYKDGKEQFADEKLRPDGKFTDERFDGRPQYYWQHIRADMKAKGGFSDDIVVFNTKPELDRYQQLYQKEIQGDSVKEPAQKGDNADMENIHNYIAMQKQLEKQLDDYHVELNDQGIAVDKATHENLSLSNAVSQKDKIRIADSIIIAKQITNYRNMNDAQTRLAMVKSDYQSVLNKMKNVPDSDITKSDVYQKMLTEYTERITELEQTMKQCSFYENAYEKDRNQISSITAVNEVNEELQPEQEQKASTELEQGKKLDIDDNTQTMDEWQEQIADRRQLRSNDIERDMPVRGKGAVQDINIPVQDSHER